MATVIKLADTQDFTTFGEGAPYLAKARELRQLFIEDAPAGEKKRSPTDRAAAALKDNNLLTLMLPTAARGWQ